MRIEIQRKISDKKRVGDWCGYVVWVNQFNCGSNFLGLKKKIKKAFILGQTTKIAQFAFRKNGKTFWAKLGLKFWFKKPI